MAILDTIKRVVPYIKSSAGYILCRLSSNAVEMDDGNTLQEAYDTLNSKILVKQYTYQNLTIPGRGGVASLDITMNENANDYTYAVPIFERINNSESGGIGESQCYVYRMLITEDNLHANIRNVRQDSSGALKVDVTFNVLFIK